MTAIDMLDLVKVSKQSRAVWGVTALEAEQSLASSILAWRPAPCECAVTVLPALCAAVHDAPVQRWTALATAIGAFRNV